MRDGPRTSQIRWDALALSSVLFALLPVVFSAVYVEILGAPRTAAVGHAQVVGLVWLVLFSLRAAIYALPLGRVWREVLSAFVIALLVVSASIYYILVVVGLVSWGRVISKELMVAYAAQAPGLLSALQIPPLFGLIVLAVVLLTVWAIAFAYVRRFDWIGSLLQQRSRVFVLALVVPLASIAVIHAAELEHKGWAYLGEPLSLTLYPEQGETWRSIRLPNSQPDPNAPARTAELDRIENAIRSAYRPNPAAIKPNVIVISVDALRADHMSVLGYARPTTPYLQQLQNSGNLAQVSSSYAVCTESACGLLAIANSRYADGSPSRPMGMPAVLRHHGYGIHMILGGDHTHFYGLRETYGRVDSYYDGASQTDRYVNDDRLVLDRVRRLGDWDGKPVMFQFHLMSSHLLGSRFDDTPSFGPSENYSKIRFLPDRPGARERAINYYDRGVLQTDRVIRELLELLRERGYMREAVVVITADHGEALGEHGLYTHTNGVLEAQLKVPLLIMTFGKVRIAPARASALLSPVDIAPTLADAFGMPIPESWAGRPLRLVEAPRQVYFSQGNWEGLVSQGDDGRIYKYWIDRRKVQEYAYDLTADPAERHNIVAKLPLPLKMAWLDALNARAGREPQKLHLGLREQEN